METHVKVLGIVNIVSGVLGLCGALVLMLVFGGVMGIVGADAGEGAEVALPIIGLTGGLLVMFIVITSLPAVIIGYGLYKIQPWSRIAGIVLSIVSLLWFPLGTILGVYGLWVLFSAEGQRVFDSPAARA